MAAVTIIPQSEFVTIKNSGFMLKGREVKFLGFNAYYLQNEAAIQNNRYIVDDVFSFANRFGFKVIRTWAFNNSSDSAYPSVISQKPNEFLEQGLIGLDYVVAKAREKGILLILTLANNFPDYGGIDQYIKWANKYLDPSKNYSHNHFFTEDSVITWYKTYISTILNRVNTFTGITYKDDPTIFSFELINEGLNSGFSYIYLKNWYENVSEHFKQIDTNHLLATGEIGYDVDSHQYSNLDFFYNSADFLFNGSKGTSFIVNSSLPQIDYTSTHSYPEAWGMNTQAGLTWIKDHSKISEQINKPMIVGEFGAKQNKAAVYTEWLKEIGISNGRSAIVWHYVHKDVVNNDGYGFNEFDTPELIELFQNFIMDLERDSAQSIAQIPTEVKLYQNFPNPFNPTTTIRYSLPSDDYVSLELYNSLGELIEEIETGFKQRGEYELNLSFNNDVLASGIYIYLLRTSNTAQSKKLILLK